MISKCSNIVINRTKFSDFEDFDVTSDLIENLKLVGYVESVDKCTGEKITENVAVKYPINDAKRPPNYFIYSLTSQPLNSNNIIKELVSGNSISHRVQGTFQGDFIQINFKEGDLATSGTIFSKHEEQTCFDISFDQSIEHGRTIKVLFNSFPIHKKGLTARLLNYTKATDGLKSVPTSYILFENDERFSEINHPMNFLVTFTQTNMAEAMSDDNNTHIMVPTNIELID